MLKFKLSAFNQLVAGSNPARPTIYKQKRLPCGGVFVCIVWFVEGMRTEFDKLASKGSLDEERSDEARRVITALRL